MAKVLKYAKDFILIITIHGVKVFDESGNFSIQNSNISNLVIVRGNKSGKGWSCSIELDAKIISKTLGLSDEE